MTTRLPRRWLLAMARFTLACVVGVSGCWDGERVGGPQESEATVIVSDPTSSVSMVGQGAGPSPAAPAGPDVAYISIQPGTVPGGENATIRNSRNGNTVMVVMVDGGFDPQTVEAAAGDTLQVEVQVTGSPALVRLTRVVPLRSRPRVVRTNPTPTKRDVPLNASIVIVFSEPIDPSVLSRASIRLQRGSLSVPGRLEFRDPANLVAAFTPERSLVADTEYELVITETITDRDGEALVAPVLVQFTTTDLAGRLAFHRFSFHPEKTLLVIEIMDADGYGRTTLINDGYLPAWSPDGRKIAYADAPQIRVMNADGSGVIGLTEGETPAWSPDGGKIVFSKNIEGGSQIYVMNADGSGVTQLTDTLFGGGSPSWSPDGRKIVFSAPPWDYGRSGLYVMNANGSGVVRLTSNPDWDPTWSPDGTKIAFTGWVGGGVSGGGGRNQIFVLNADGSGVTQLTDEGGRGVSDPAWSPDGTKIAFSGYSCDRTYGCQTGLFVMNADGSRLRRLTLDGANIIGGLTWTARPARP